MENLLAKEGVAGSIPVSRSEQIRVISERIPPFLLFRAHPVLEVRMPPMDVEFICELLIDSIFC